MTKEQWTVMYSAARLLARSKYYCGDLPDNKSIDYDDPSRKLAAELAYQQIVYMGYGVADAIYGHTLGIYPIEKYKWAAKHNSKAFDRKSPIRESKMKWRNAK